MADCGCFSHDGFLTEAGYAEVAQRELELDGVDNTASLQYLDKVGSVSGLVEVEGSYEWDDQYLDQQYRRFLNGS